MNRHFRNTLSAISATAVMLAAVLLVAGPARTLTVPVPSEVRLQASAVTAVPAPPRKQATVNAMQVRQANDIAIRAERLAAQLEKAKTTGETIAHVAAFTAEVATVTALAAALGDLPDEVETTGIAELAAPAATPARRTGSSKRSRQSLAMPFFSFATRS